MTTRRACLDELASVIVECRDAVRNRYRKRYVPGQRLYLERCRPVDGADVVFRNDDLPYPEVEYRGIARRNGKGHERSRR